MSYMNLTGLKGFHKFISSLIKKAKRSFMSFLLFYHKHKRCTVGKGTNSLIETLVCTISSMRKINELLCPLYYDITLLKQLVLLKSTNYARLSQKLS